MSTNNSKKTRIILIGFSSIVFLLVAFGSLSNPISVPVNDGGATSSSSSSLSTSPQSIQVTPQDEVTFDSNNNNNKIAISSFDPQHVIQVGKQCYLSRWGGGNGDYDKCNSNTAQEGTPIATTSSTTTLPSGHEVTVTNLLCATNRCLKISLKSADAKNGKSPWTEDAETKNVADSLHLGAKWLEGYVVIKAFNSMNQSRSELTGIRTMKRFFLWKEDTPGDGSEYYRSCVCGIQRQPWMRSGFYSIDIYLFDLFKNYDALVETGEDLPVQYFTSMKNEKAVITLDGDQLLQNEKCEKGATDNEPAPFFAEWEVDVQRDQSTNYETDSRYGGYWLRFKGDKTKGNKFSDSHDLLGRMDFRAKYKFRGGKVRRNNNNQGIDCAQRVAPPPCAKNDCFASALSLMGASSSAAVSLVFVGDSHVRTLYYGLLGRLGVPFAANRVWRGGHEADVILPGVAAKVKFVPSSFLDMKTVDGAVSQVFATSGKNKKVILVAGLGQHHSTHCYTLKRHAAAVKTAIDYFAEKMKLVQRNNNNKNNNTLHLIWYGVPAQPVNRHLFAPKPVGQARKDCRSNSRHLLYSAVQQSLILKAREENNNNRDFRFIDAFALSAGLTFTSVDGAHYYSFARDAMLDSLGEELAELF